MEAENQIERAIYSVSSVESAEFTRFTGALSRSSVIGLDAEWKPLGADQSAFPTVSLLQIACQDGTLVFLIDLLAIPLSSFYGLLRDVLVSPHILKLGFRFKQDLAYLSSTFCSQGCHPGFDRVEPFLDIKSIYNYLLHKQPGRKVPKQSKSLAAICEEVLGISLSKELQCSDWSCRPLTEEQKAYAAADAHCLLEIFNVFQRKVIREGNSFQIKMLKIAFLLAAHRLFHNEIQRNIILFAISGVCSRDIMFEQITGNFLDYFDAGNSFHTVTELGFSYLDLGLKEILVKPNSCDTILRTKFCEALEIVRATTTIECFQRIPSVRIDVSRVSSLNTIPMDDSILQIVGQYCDKILLKESDRKPKMSKKKGKRKPSETLICKGSRLENADDWQGLPPWDLTLGGDGCPKFLCDVMVEGLAKHLRCVGIDAAVPYCKKPETRVLIDQAQREKRVLLTRDVKLLRHEYLIKNQIYRVKSLLKNEQLLEVIETFQLKISEDQLMSRCTKCNGRFIQKPLTTEEAVEAAKGFQVIPNCLFDKNLAFWQCMDCNQLYWEGTQYHNAVQKFIDVCKLHE